MPADQAVVVFTSADYLEAQLVACAPQGHEISAFVFDNYICRILRTSSVLVGGIKVIVYQRDLEQTLDVLRLVFSGDPPFARRSLSIPMSDLAIWLTIVKAIVRILRRTN